MNEKNIELLYFEDINFNQNKDLNYIINKYNELKNEYVNRNKEILEHKEEIKKLNNIISKQENKYMVFINELNLNFSELFCVSHNIFEDIKNIIFKLENTNPKKIQKVLNLFNNIYIKEMEKKANMMNNINKKHINLSNEFIRNKKTI